MILHKAKVKSCLLDIIRHGKKIYGQIKNNGIVDIITLFVVFQQNNINNAK